MGDCANPLFPRHDGALPARARAAELVALSVPTLLSAMLWMLHERRRRAARFTPGMLAGARLAILATTAAQGVLLHRAFEIFECEAAFPDAGDWVALPLAILAVAQLVLAGCVADRFPRACCALALAMAGACVAGEYLGRDVARTAAVQTLLPLQQLFCVQLVAFLAFSPPPAGSARTTARAKTRATAAWVSIDPLQRRQACARTTEHG